jgi:TldD protein
MRKLLRDALDGATGFVELRYHAKTFQSISVDNGKLERTSMRRRDGVSVRVLRDGTWGCASTDELQIQSIKEAIGQAEISAKATAAMRKDRVPDLPIGTLAVGDFATPGIADVLGRSLAEKIALTTEAEAQARKASSRIQSAGCAYNEIHESKAIVTTDGADCSFELVRPEFRIRAVAERDGEMSSAFESIGVTGGWDCLFRSAPALLAEKAAQTAVDLLGAGHPEGGWATIIMSPSIVGLMVHEAVGHTVEADFVQAGSVAAGKLGQQVASELVTLCDSGASEHMDGAGGTILVDDEGVPAERTVIIEQGKLVSYLHNRESAARMGVATTGSARAWEYTDQPLIRMRNTYIEPGDTSLEEMIATCKDGWFLDGPRNGQADATGEFMFGVTTARRIKDGKLCELVKGVTVTGNAFEVLGTVDAVSKEFVWDLGSGHCGKGQPAKVDAGGPYIRCRAILGGQQA